MLIKAEQLDKQIRIERFTETRDPDYNTPIKTWETFAEVWAQVQDVLPSKAETLQEGVEVTERPSRVRMRWLPGIAPDMRVVIVGVGEPDRITEIVAGPAELGRREGIELQVKAFNRQGA
ncbi:head-tail adaptor protein [Xenophilus sp. Marseille-Q4582]|uniref:head-tail adaptor protein n=1 Tax=Xenophilus sp. Marseille-Q4582 TaxID=2866600 RepID=UPI001CE4207D|nr:head-tail adaptor protein [Xenophilus sp. Marseille-Q4582]